MSIKIKISLIMLLLTAMLCSSCAARKSYNSAKRSYNYGSFDHAFNGIVSTVKRWPDHKKSLLIIEEITNRTIRFHEENVDIQKRKGDWDAIVKEYQSIEKMRETVRKLPCLKHPKTKKEIILQVPDVFRQLGEAKKKAADIHYEKGMAHLQKKEYKAAIREMLSSVSFIDSYKDANDLIKKYKDQAVTRISVIPFRNETKKNLGEYEYICGFLMDKIIGKGIEKTSLVEFVTRTELDMILKEQKLVLSDIFENRNQKEIGQLYKIDAFVLGNIRSLEIHFPPPIKNNRYYKGYIKGKGTVSTKVTQTMIEGKVNLIASSQIIDIHLGLIDAANVIDVKAQDKTHWSYYHGEKSLIPRNYNWGKKRNLKTKKELLNECVDEVSTKIVQMISEVYD